LSDRYKKEKAARENEREGKGDYNDDKKIASPSEESIVPSNAKTTIEEKGTGEEYANNEECQAERTAKTKRSLSSSLKSIFGIFGPGVITGASDDDPSGIATYSQAGAQFGFGMLWMVLFLYPLMTVVQEICARIGLVTGSGLAAVIKKRHSKKIVYPIASLLLIANTINIGADIGAMSASVRLIFPQLPFFLVTLAFTAFILLSEIFVPYNKYVKILKYLTLSLFAYVATTIIVGGNLQQILINTIVPHIEFNANFAMLFVAVIGTTISPYLFFWQASEEAEEDVAKKKIKEIGKGRPKVSKKEIKVMRGDVMVGMAFSVLIMYSIMVSTAGTMHANGITDIATADQAAKALQPLVKSFPNAGEIAETIFALGIIGTGLLAVPVLAGSCGYALSEAFGWKQGLSRKFGQAKYFYLIIAASTVIGLWINFTNIDPIKALIYTAVINGIIALPMLFAIMRIANDKKILGKDMANRRISNVLGWGAFIVMTVSVLILFVTWGR
jgi:NRAMP (natural resistance-associated macrophage protein)-like metal ion transporter